MKACHELLKDFRNDNDMKQTDIAEMIGTTQQQYSKYETGESELPLRALSILADFYGVSADYLMGRTDCREGVADMNKKLVGDYTVGAFTSDMQFLDGEGRKAVMEYIALHKMRITCTCTKRTASTAGADHPVRD